MSPEYKKLTAREFLIIISILVLSTIFYASFYFYNESEIDFNNKVETIRIEIGFQSEQFKNSANRIAQIKDFRLKAYYPIYYYSIKSYHKPNWYDEYQYSKTFEEFYEEIKNNVEIKKNIFRDHVESRHQIDFKDWESMVFNQFNIDKVMDEFEELHVLNTLIFEKRHYWRKVTTYSEDEIMGVTLWFGGFMAAIMYVLRPLWLMTRWSIKTLKDV